MFNFDELNPGVKSFCKDEAYYAIKHVIDAHFDTWKLLINAEPDEEYFRAAKKAIEMLSKELSEISPIFLQ